MALVISTYSSSTVLNEVIHVKLSQQILNKPAALTVAIPWFLSALLQFWRVFFFFSLQQPGVLEHFLPIRYPFPAAAVVTLVCSIHCRSPPASPARSP